jgi:hypothetical protein
MDVSDLLDVDVGMMEFMIHLSFLDGVLDDIKSFLSSSMFYIIEIPWRPRRVVEHIPN